MNCYAMYYYAKQAKLDGKPMSRIDRIIETFSDLIHMEFWFSERHDRISFSATMQGDFDGCRFLQIKYSHPLRWIKQLLPMTIEQEIMAYDKACEIDGMPYDLKGAAATAVGASRIIKPAEDGYWCNEACGELIKAAYCWADFKPDTQLPIDTFFEIHRRLGKE